MIRIEHITKYYGAYPAVDGISFEIRKGEVLGLLGPNGAGKTTTMRILTCYLRPTSGDIRVKDFSIHDHPLEIKKLIGYLPESAPLYPDMLVYDYLGFVADVRGIRGSGADSRIRKLAGMCGINEVMHRPIGELSKGYRQRVGLAHAMMGDPEILVLDEPTSGLDPNQIVEIRDIIKEIGKEKTVVLSTHILSEAEAACDRIVIINRGRIAADGSTDQLRQEAGADYAVLITLQKGEAAEVREKLGSVQGVKDIALDSAGNGPLDVRLRCGGREVRPDLYEVIRQNNWTLLEFRREAKTLESVFRDLTREA